VYSRSEHSSSVASTGSGFGYAQYCSTATPPASTTSRWPGISFRTAASGVIGPGTNPSVMKASIAS
jgi:hypothetical protein